MILRALYVVEVNPAPPPTLRNRTPPLYQLELPRVGQPAPEVSRSLIMHELTSPPGRWHRSLSIYSHESPAKFEKPTGEHTNNRRDTPMKTRLVVVTTCIVGLLAAGLTIPAIAQPKDGEGSSWRARRGGSECGGEMPRDGAPRRGPGGPADGEAGHGFGPPPRGPGGPGGGPLEGAIGHAMRSLHPFWDDDNLTTDLNLSVEQIASLEESHELTKTKLEETEGSVRDAGETLREEMQKDSPDIAVVNGLVDTLTEATNEKAKIVLGHAVVVKNVLTAEQEETLKKNARHGGPESAGELRQLLQEVRGIVHNGGTLDDVKQAIDDSDLSDPMKDRAIKMAEDRAEKLRSGDGAVRKGAKGPKE